MTLYVKKPIPIEARQITVENADELAAWSNSTVVKRPFDDTVSGMMVYTLEGTMTGAIGDYLIKGVRGEFYFCAKSIFEESYDEYKDVPDDYIHVNEIIDQPDGSAIINFEIGYQTIREFAKIGILKVLTDEANRVLE
jgi:hypothetical protein